MFFSPFVATGYSLVNEGSQRAHKVALRCRVLSNKDCRLVRRYCRADWRRLMRRSAVHSGCGRWSKARMRRASICGLGVVVQSMQRREDGRATSCDKARRPVVTQRFQLSPIIVSQFLLGWLSRETLSDCRVERSRQSCDRRARPFRRDNIGRSPAAKNFRGEIDDDGSIRRSIGDCSAQVRQI